MALDGEATESPEAWGKRKEKKASQGIDLHLPLQVASRQWPTPQARDYRSPDLKGSRNYERKVSKGYTIDLNSRAANWPTPNDGEEPETFFARQKKWAGTYHNSTPLKISAKVHGLQDLKETGAASPNTSGLRLNPRFVEWLMGFPDEWTVCEPSATLSSRSKQHSRSDSSSQGSNNE